MSSEIPVIDIFNPSPEVAKEVLSAATTHGFLFIQNDGKTIPPSDIATMFDLSKSFFNQPPAAKSIYAIHSSTAGGTNRGWVHMSGESLDPSNTTIKGDPKEAFNIAPPTPTTPLQPLPPPLDAHAALITRFQANCHALCVRILDLLGTALRVSEEGYFGKRHGEGEAGTIFRMLYYPATQNPSSVEGSEAATSIRAGAHSDYGSLTLLFRLPGQPGLELLTANDTWVPVPVDPAPAASTAPPILVNIGDLLCYWTNGLLKSTVHRVVFAGGEERYSMAYFCHPLDEVRLESVESEVIREFGERGREELERQRRRVGVGEGEKGVLTAREHLERRLKVTYGI